MTIFNYVGSHKRTTNPVSAIIVERDKKYEVYGTWFQVHYTSETFIEAENWLHESRANKDYILTFVGRVVI